MQPHCPMHESDHQVLLVVGGKEDAHSVLLPGVKGVIMRLL